MREYFEHATGPRTKIDHALDVVIAKQSTHPLAWDEKRFADLLCGFAAICRELRA